MNKWILSITIIAILALGVTSAFNLVEADQNGNVKVITPTGEVPSYVVPSEDKESNTKRIIADSISPKDISNFIQQGCSVKHLLKDATALECPTSVVPTLKNVREDKLLQIHDLDADIQINADDVWNGVPSYTGAGVVIAILDTGIDTKHIELQDSIIKTKSFKGNPKDSNGHGTHVSGIITGNGVFEISNNFGYPSPNKATGVAPDAGIIMGKVCAPRGCFYSDIAAGIEWAVAEGADVISISIGGSPIGGDNCDGDFIADKANWAVDNGVVVVVSSGNDYSSTGVSSPACGSKVIAVGAVDQSDTVADFSNSGPALDIVAPGVGVLSTYSCDAAGDCGSYWYAWMSGTSMAAPHVAGAAALVLQSHPGFSVDQVKDALYSTAKDVGSQDGNGRVDVLGAVNYLSAPDTEVPIISNIVYPTTSTTATITWNTNEPATSLVEYGLDNTYGSPASDNNLVTSHSIVLTGLDSSTIYHFKITSVDGSNNSASTADLTFETLSPPTLDSISITPSSASISEGSTQQFTATGTYSDDTTKDLTAEVAWSSSDTAVATIDNVGVATGMSVGSIVMTATYSNLSPAISTLEVTAAPEEPTTVSVSSITYATEGGKFQDKHLLITIALLDDDDIRNPVSGASVSIDLYRDGSKIASGTATTGSSGTITFSLKNAASGLYKTVVTGVTASGLIWDDITPPNEFDKQNQSPNSSKPQK